MQLTDQAKEPRIAVFKLLTGEELIATTKLTDDGVMVVNMPMVTIITIENGQTKVSLQRWCVAGDTINPDEWLALNPLSVVLQMRPTKDAVEAYEGLKHKLTSNIIQPTPEETALING